MILFFVVTLSLVYNFANDNTLHLSNKESEIVFRNLGTDLNNALVWFNINSVKAIHGSGNKRRLHNGS